MTLSSSQPTTSPLIRQIQTYLETAERHDLEAAAAFFTPDLLYRVPGRNRLSGDTHGQRAALTYFGSIMNLTRNSYRVQQKVDFMTADDQVVLLATEEAQIGERRHVWDRLVLFTFQGELIAQVQLFEDDQLALDAFLGATDAEATDPGPVDDWTPGPPEMSGNVQDPRVQAIMAYQLNVARGDLAAARTIFDPQVEYHVSGRNRLAGDYHGPDEVMGYFARLGELTGGSYGISRMRWLTSPDRVALLTRNHATCEGRSLSWDEVIVFQFQDGRKRRIDLYSGDQYGVDALFGSQTGAK
jgi:uncharacterized protein